MNGFGPAHEVKEKEVTLSFVMRYMKRVKERISQIESRIQSNNSLIAKNESRWDVRKLLDERENLVAHLVEVKLRAEDATREIKPKILRLSELKGTISFLRRIPVLEGLVEKYGKEPLEYKSEMKEDEIEKNCIKLQSVIDELQTEIDAYNASTKITFTSMV